MDPTKAQTTPAASPDLGAVKLPAAEKPAPQSRLRRTARALLEVAGFTTLAVIANRVDARISEGSRSVHAQNSSGMIKVHAEGVPAEHRAMLENLPTALESSLKTIQKIDPIVAPLVAAPLTITIGTGLRLESAWVQAQGAGDYLVNRDLLFDLVRRDIGVDGSGFAAVAASILAPKLCTHVRAEVFYQDLQRQRLPTSLLASAQVAGTILACEGAASTVLTDQNSKRALISLEAELATHDVFVGWRYDPNLVLTPAEITSVLNRTYGYPTATDTRVNFALHDTCARLESFLGKPIEPAPFAEGQEELARKFAIQAQTIALDVCTTAQAAIQRSTFQLCAAAAAGRRVALPTFPFWITEVPVDSDRIPLAVSYLLTHRAALAAPQFSGEVNSRYGRTLLDLASANSRALKTALATGTTDHPFPMSSELSVAFELTTNLCRLAESTNDRAVRWQIQSSLIGALTEVAEHAITTFEKSPENLKGWCKYGVFFALVETRKALNTLPEDADLNLLSARIEETMKMISANHSHGVQTSPLSAPVTFAGKESLSTSAAAWIAMWEGGSISTVDNRIPSDYSEFGLTDSIQTLLEQPLFQGLTRTAQAQVVESLFRDVEGPPRKEISSSSVRQTELVAPGEIAEFFRSALTHLEQIEDKTVRSLIVETLATMPPSYIRELSDIERTADRMRVLIPRDAQSSFMISLRGIQESNSEYHTVNIETLVATISARVTAESYWARNVSVLSSVNEAQLSFSIPFVSDYDDLMLAGVRSGKSIDGAQESAKQRLEADPIPISHPSVWVTSLITRLLEGDWDNSLDPGVRHQNPQAELGSAPLTTPKHALILCGENRPRDLFMSFEGLAQDWSSTLSRAFGTESTIIKPTSDDQLKSTIDEFMRKRGESNDDVLIVLIGHGNRNSAHLRHYSAFLRTSSGSGNGYVSMTREYSIKEPFLKRLVNSYVAPHAKAVGIVVSSCHSGAWVK